MNDALIGAVELGGTKVRVGLVRGDELVDDITVDTTAPGQTLGPAVEFLQTAGVEAVGIASFGPIGLDPSEQRFGIIGETPKPHWSGADVVQPFRALSVPIGLDTDVAGSGLGEVTFGSHTGCSPFVYITVGTGIGGSVVIDGHPLRGRGHPEMGHMIMTPQPDDPFPGVCPFHGRCLEGLASGTAIAQRWGAPGIELEDRPEVWDLEARYLAQAVRTLTYTVAPERIAIGGGVTHQPGLLDAVRNHTQKLLGGYATDPSLPDSLDSYVVAPSLGQDAGLWGAAVLGRSALDGS